MDLQLTHSPETTPLPTEYEQKKESLLETIEDIQVVMSGNYNKKS